MLDLKINQLRNSPTYMTKTDPFAIDLTFTSRPSLTTEYLSLSSHENLFLQIVGSIVLLLVR